MHILLLVLAVLGAIAFWWFRLRNIAAAGSDIIDQVAKVRGAVRRYNFQKQAETSVISNIQDPAIAATVFLFSLANQKVAFLDDAKLKIAELVSEIVDPQDLYDVVGFSEWVANSVPSPDDPIYRFKALWLDRLNSSEREEFLNMAHSVASVGSWPSPAQALTLTSLTRALGWCGGRASDPDRRPTPLTFRPALPLIPL